MYLLQNPKITNPQTYKECLSCELYKYCNAGCTFQQINNSNKPLEYAKPVRNICDLLKITYKETMRINEELKNNSLYKTTVRNLIKNIG